MLSSRNIRETSKHDEDEFSFNGRKFKQDGSK